MPRKPSTQCSHYELHLRRDSSKKAKVATPTTPTHHGDRHSGDGPEAAPPRRFLSGPQVCARYAITDMSLWRWLRDPELGFPQPTMRIRDRRYWLETDLVTWEQSHIPHGDDAVPPRRAKPPPPKDLTVSRCQT
jgi:predicted DNA-binding transcriptional regulator AlpA